MKIFKLFIDENIKTWKKLSTKIMIIAIILSLFAVLALVKFMEKTEENLLVYNSDNSTGENEKEFLEREIEFYESQLKNEKLDEETRLVTERNLHWWYQAYSYGVKGYMCNCSPCGAGIQTIAIGPMGDVFVCDQYYGDERFKIGQLFSNDLRNIINNSHYVISKLRNLYNVEACKKCIWRYVCSGGCSAASFYYNNEKNDGVAPYCEAYKKIFEYMELKSQCSNLLL